MTKTLEQLAQEYRAAAKALKLADKATEEATEQWDAAIIGKEAMRLVNADEKLRRAARKGKGLLEAARNYRDAQKVYAELGVEKLERKRDESFKAESRATDRVEELAEAMQRLAMRLP